MSDWREAEIREQETPKTARDERLSPEGINRMQGHVDTNAPEQPEDTDKATVHSGDSIEGGPKPETQPETVKLGTEGESEQPERSHAERRKPEPPEGWHPGGPER